MRLSGVVTVGLVSLALATRALAEECDPNDPTLLKPNLVAMTPSRVRVVQRNGNRRIIFGTTIGNVGKGPLIITGQTYDTSSGPVTQATQQVQRTDGTTCTHVAGYFEYHVSHHHWHINDFAEYQLRKDDPFTGEIVARASKVSFCLIDIMRLRGFHTTRQVFANCGTQEGTQGISAGYADVYDNFLPDQWIDLDAGRSEPVPAGRYFLVNVADPDNLMLEVSDDLRDKTGVVSVSVPGPISGTSRGPHGPRPPHNPRPSPSRQRVGHGPHMQ